MPDRPLKFRDLRRILASFGIWEEPSRGKGGHTCFRRHNESGGIESFPVPRHGNEVSRVYVRGLRVKFHLRAEDGVTDEEFYGR